MVRALLNGSKTQTRRVVKWPSKSPTHHISINESEQGPIPAWCPYGQPGDRLWVRESIFAHPAYSSKDLAAGICGPLFEEDGSYCAMRGYMADGDHSKPFRVIPGIHMPRAASRILLEITAVRCERLQDISEADAVAEGVNVVNIGKTKGVEYENYLDDDCFEFFAKDSYATLWEKINGLGSFADNPWIWVVEFKVIDGKEAVSA